MAMILYLMILLGIVQPIWAMIHLNTTQFAQVKKLFTVYMIGVGIYFLILALMLGGGSIDQPIVPSMVLGIHFFGSAFALAIFHFGIVGYSLHLRGTRSPDILLNVEH